MTGRGRLAVALGIVILLILGVFWLRAGNSADNNGSAGTTTPETTMQPYTLGGAGISFSYPTTYFIATSTTAATGTPASVTLFEDIPDNHNLNQSTPREGPVSISLMVYPNPKNLSADQWVKANATTSNYSLKKGEGTVKNGIIGEKDAFEYEWSGLYEGKSDVVTNGGKAYVWSVTHLTPDDAIITDYQIVLGTVSFDGGTQ